MDRYCGFYKALLEHGEELPAEWLIEDRDRTGNVEFSVPEKLPEAFVCNCDLTAGILMIKLEEMGYKIPGDVAVIGFDNFLYPGFPDKKITTYEVNTRAMVKIALGEGYETTEESFFRKGTERCFRSDHRERKCRKPIARK